MTALQCMTSSSSIRYFLEEMRFSLSKGGWQEGSAGCLQGTGRWAGAGGLGAQLPSPQSAMPGHDLQLSRQPRPHLLQVCTSQRGPGLPALHVGGRVERAAPGTCSGVSLLSPSCITSITSPYFCHRQPCEHIVTSASLNLAELYLSDPRKKSRFCFMLGPHSQFSASTNCPDFPAHAGPYSWVCDSSLCGGRVVGVCQGAAKGTEALAGGAPADSHLLAQAMLAVDL